jgi:hypothetical protein
MCVYMYVDMYVDIYISIFLDILNIEDVESKLPGNVRLRLSSDTVSYSRRRYVCSKETVLFMLCIEVLDI